MLHLDIPGDSKKVLLHCCCAPCSGAVVECLVDNGVRPVLFFSNSNITPYAEYELRRSELERYAAQFGLKVIDDEYDHQAWLDYVLCRNVHESPCPGETFLPPSENGTVGTKSAEIEPTPSPERDGRHASGECAKTSSEEDISKALAQAPERGPRCQRCFEYRLRRAAMYARAHGLEVLTTTLASSRWKSLEQVDEAGRRACEATGDAGCAVKPPPEALPEVQRTDRGGVGGSFPRPLGVQGDGSIPPEDLTSGGRRPTEGERSDVGGTVPRAPGGSRAATGEIIVPPNAPIWWNQNWRKGGLQPRRAEIIKEQNFYNQTWCGCEYSHKANETK